MQASFCPSDTAAARPVDRKLAMNWRGEWARLGLEPLEKPPHFVVSTGKGKHDAVRLDFEYQPQVQSNTHFKVVFHEFADAEPGMLMWLTQCRLQPINGLTDLDPCRLWMRSNNLSKTRTEENLATHGC